MTKQEIDNCFEQMNHQNKNLLKWIPLIGIAITLIGVTMICAVPKYNSNLDVISKLIAGIGVFMLLFLSPILYFSSKSTIKKIEFVRNTLVTEPKKLVWAYIYEITQNGIKNHFIVMKFRDGEELQVHKSAFKEFTLEDFLYGLKSNYNTDIVLGFSEENKQLYLNGQL
jgi:hypothetical protein